MAENTAPAQPKKLSFKEMLLRGVGEDEKNQSLGVFTAPSSSDPSTASPKPVVSTAVAKTEPAEPFDKDDGPSRQDIEKSTATVHYVQGEPLIHSYVLDAGPLLAQTFSDLQKHASHFYTTPAVLHTEVRDVRSRQNVELWKTAGKLTVRQPSARHIAAITDFSKRTGDFAVLSTNDIHILALARELDVENHGGSDRHLKKGPGAESARRQKELEKANFNAPVTYNIPVERIRPDHESEEKKEDEPKEETAEEDDGWAVVTSKKKGKKSWKSQNNNAVSEEPKKEANVEELVSKMGGLEVTTSVEEEEEDENGWITEDNILDTMRQDQYEPEKSSFMSSMKKKNPNSNDNTNIVITEDKKEDKSKDFLPTAVSTGDFAMQNVALQMGLNLVSPVDGKYIKQVKSHMLRCHACFNLCPVPRTNDVDEIMRRRQQGNVISTDGESKNYANASLSSSVMGRGFNFCPKCGAGGTLRRCTVRVDGKDGHIHVYLKRNMQWSTRGNVFQLPATQSKKARRATRQKDPYNFGNSKSGESQRLILREDQVEYERAIVHDYKLKKHNERVLEDWIGGSIGGGNVGVGDVSVPFAYHRDAARHTGIKIRPGGKVSGSGNANKH